MFFEKISKIDNSLAKLNKKNREMTKLNIKMKEELLQLIL